MTTLHFIAPLMTLKSFEHFGFDGLSTLMAIGPIEEELGVTSLKSDH